MDMVGWTVVNGSYKALLWADTAGYVHYANDAVAACPAV